MTQAIQKLLVANRGEIAVRIIHAANGLGIPTVLACSEADVDSMAARLADEIHVLGPARADKSYLNIPLMLDALKVTRANAVHPGYGFLSENAAFADAVNEAGAIFVGPSSDTIRRMGDKAEARRTAKEAGVPVVPGTEGEVHSLEQAIEAAAEVGFPLLIKASAGGGGRGIRLAESMEQLAEEFPVLNARHKLLSGMAAFIWSALFARLGTLKCRFWVTVSGQSTCSNGSAHFSVAGKRFWKRRHHRSCRWSSESRFAAAQFA